MKQTTFLKPKKQRRKLYFAYGANTNLQSMAVRCPAAELIGIVTLPGWELVFRGVADIVENDRSEVVGTLWSITERCEASLDAFEGFPHLYGKAKVPVQHEGVEDRYDTAMVYVMKARRGLAPPSGGYYDCLYEGYSHNGIPLRQLYHADAASMSAVEDGGPVYISKNWG